MNDDSTLTRRDFLAMGATAAVVAPAIFAAPT